MTAAAGANHGQGVVFSLRDAADAGVGSCALGWQKADHSQASMTHGHAPAAIHKLDLSILKKLLGGSLGGWALLAPPAHEVCSLDENELALAVLAQLLDHRVVYVSDLLDVVLVDGALPA